MHSFGNGNATAVTHIVQDLSLSHKISRMPMVGMPKFNPWLGYFLHCIQSDKWQWSSTAVPKNVAKIDRSALHSQMAFACSTFSEIEKVTMAWWVQIQDRLLAPQFAPFETESEHGEALLCPSHKIEHKYFCTAGKIRLMALRYALMKSVKIGVI